jgi:hypothetical protein
MKGPERMKKPIIHCTTHGDSPFSIICQHLCNETGLKYYCTKYGPEHPANKQAWCDKCHRVLVEEYGWSERAKRFADLSPVCEGCFNAVLSRHLRVPLVA